MKSEPRQFCRTIRLCSERYSLDTEKKVVNMLTSHERVIRLEQLVDKELPEDEFLAELNRIEKEGR